MSRLDLPRLALIYPAPVDLPREAQATDKPCELHRSHSPVVVRTQGHHVFPMYLQRRVYAGVVRLDDLLWLCGTGHDSLHAWLGWALGETYRPDVRPGWQTMRQVDRVMDWYRAAAA